MPGDIIIEHLSIDRIFHNVPASLQQLILGLVLFIGGWYMPYMFAGVIMYLIGLALLIDCIVSRFGGWNF
jgi:hypothetical protein